MNYLFFMEMSARRQRIRTIAGYLLPFSVFLFFSCGNVAPPPPEVVSAPESLPDAVMQEAPSDFDMTTWVDLAMFAPAIQRDIRYATANNFVGKVLYPCGRCLLRPAVAQALAKAQTTLEEQGYGLLVFDCYRPLDVQWVMWESVPDKRYVGDPRKGSMHNRGVAVDLTLTDGTGNPLDMGTAYDYFGKEAWPEYMDLPEEVLQHRQILREAMMGAGFQPIRTEWWHFSLPGTGSPISDAVWDCR